ncbi:hypothetical protein N0V90_008009 [Kalmusia sp. IMI 367209]|nr:hypothetical protein N0V90_008009 [Kalmusia sp. IMI 367209]
MTEFSDQLSMAVPFSDEFYQLDFQRFVDSSSSFLDDNYDLVGLPNLEIRDFSWQPETDSQMGQTPSLPQLSAPLSDPTANQGTLGIDPQSLSYADHGTPACATLHCETQHQSKAARLSDTGWNKILQVVIPRILDETQDQILKTIPQLTGLSPSPKQLKEKIKQWREMKIIPWKNIKKEDMDHMVLVRYLRKELSGEGTFFTHCGFPVPEEKLHKHKNRFGVAYHLPRKPHIRWDDIAPRKIARPFGEGESNVFELAATEKPKSTDHAKSDPLSTSTDTKTSPAFEYGVAVNHCATGLARVSQPPSHSLKRENRQSTVTAVCQGVSETSLQKEMQNLREENQRLKTRIKALQALVVCTDCSLMLNVMDLRINNSV